MTITLFLLGAWLTQCFVVAHHEHRAVGLSRAWTFVLVVVVSLGWPIIVGMAIRDVVLGAKMRA